MASHIVVGTQECPTQWIAKIIKSSQSFHLLHETWPSVARDLEVKEEEIKKLRKNMLLEKDELSEVVNGVISMWVGKKGSGATLDKLLFTLGSNELGSIADSIKVEFTLKSSHWDVPSYYISRTLISRNILDKNKLMEELQSAKDIFIFTGITMSELSNILKNKMVENSTRVVQDATINHNYILLDFPTHFSKICEKAKCPVHLIKADENGDKWIHVKSSGSLSAMRNIIDKSQAHFNEIELIKSIVDETHPVCISDSPGMGKSTLLQHIGQQLSKIENNRKVLFATMNEFVAVFIQNYAKDDVERKVFLELTLKTLFCSNAAQTSSLSLKLNSKDFEIELLLDGLDEVTSSNTSVAFDLLKYLSTIPSIRIWVTTRPHLLQDVENSLNVFGYNIQAFTKQNQISFLKDFWLLRNKSLVTDRLEQFAEICLSELNTKMSRKDGDIAGIPLQCLLIGKVYMEQAEEHSVATNPNETWIIHINSLVELYQRLIEKQYTKYKVIRLGKLLTAEQLNRQHVRLAFHLIFPELVEELPVLFQQGVNLNELLKVGLLEKSSTVFEPKFVHRTIGEFFIAKFLVEIFNRADAEILKCQDELLQKVLICQETEILLNAGPNFNQLYNINCFVSNEICHFFDTLLVEVDKSLCVDMHLNFKKLAQACIFGDFFNIFKTISFHLKPNDKFWTQIDEGLLLLTIKYSSLPFLKIILENNAALLVHQESKIRSLCLSIRNGKLPQLQYLLNLSDVRELVTQPNDETKLAIHICVTNSASDPTFVVKQKIDILRLLLNINFDLLEQQDDELGLTPISYFRIHPELLRELIKRKANVLAKQVGFQDTILHYHHPHLDMLFEELPPEKLKCLVKLENAIGKTPLWNLIDQQEPTIEILNKFHELGADFNCECNQRSVLALSIFRFRTTKTMERLIELGANVHWQEEWTRKSLLHIAGECGNVDAMRLLETKFNLNINEKDGNSKSSVEYLREFYRKRGRNLSIQQLINFLHMTEELNEGIPSENKTKLLEKYVENMNDSAVERFLKDEMSFVEHIYMCFGIVETLIRNFKLGAGSKIFESLISSGIITTYNNSLVVTTSSKNQFLIHLAVYWNNREILTYLIDEYKQNVNATDDDGMTSLLICIQGKWFNLEIANFLVSKGADVTVLDKHGNSLLHLAVRERFGNGRLEWCLSFGLDVNAANAKGESPLHNLVSNIWPISYLEDLKSKVILLCDYGADVLQVDKKGWGVLHHMANSYHMHEEVLNYLLEKGVDINAVDKEGNTPLHIAAKLSNYKFIYAGRHISLLLKKNADKTIRNLTGETPYQIYKHKILKL